MPKKLNFKIKHGKLVLTAEDRPDLDVAKKLWKEGKSSQYILEQFKKNKRS